MFWFTDYQGDRTTNGGTASEVPVLSAAERQGNVGVQNLTGTVTGAYWAQVLSQRLGRPVQVDEPYANVFPDGIIPTSAFSPATKGTIGPANGRAGCPGSALASGVAGSVGSAIGAERAANNRVISRST